MANYNITNAAANTLQSKLDDAKTLVESRRALWNALTPSKQASWKVNCPDPVINKMYKIYRYLREFFGE